MDRAAWNKRMNEWMKSLLHAGKHHMANVFAQFGKACYDIRMLKWGSWGLDDPVGSYTYSKPWLKVCKFFQNFPPPIVVCYKTHLFSNQIDQRPYGIAASAIGHVCLYRSQSCGVGNLGVSCTPGILELGSWVLYKPPLRPNEGLKRTLKLA
jgi:hypothetical protein